MTVDLKAGEGNKLKVGQKVKATKHLVNWTTSHISWLHGVSVSKDSTYREGEKEIQEKSLPEIYAWIDAKLTGDMPRGVVKHYGGTDEGTKKCLYVEFKFKTAIGVVTISEYASEGLDVVAIKFKKKK